MYSILSFSLARLTHAEIVGYFINVQKAIQKNDAETLGLDTTLVTKYGTTLQSLVDRVYVTSTSAYTAAMQTADNKRNMVYKRIRLRLQMVDCCDDNDDLLACKDEVDNSLLAKYGANVVRMAYQAKTSVIQGFIMDLNNKLTSDDRDALGIESDISALDTANAEFITAYNNRIAEKAEAETGVTVKLREEMMDYYGQICFTAQYLANAIATSLASQTAANKIFISQLNVLLADVKKRYMQRISGTAEEETEDETESVVNENPETPTES